MAPRMSNPATTVPGALDALLALARCTENDNLPKTTRDIVHLRVSQINGCSYCVDMHAKDLKKAGESDERVFGVGAWRDSPFFSDAERAALGLAEAVTRLSDNPDPVPDDVWNEAAKHYDEPAL